MTIINTDTLSTVKKIVDASLGCALPSGQDLELIDLWAGAVEAFHARDLERFVAISGRIHAIASKLFE
jgi:hypothetical protein